MQEVKKLQQPTITTDLKVSAVYSSPEKIAEALERNGWSREIAGDNDFSKAVKAITLALQRGRGIWVSGDAGVGKTALMKAIQKMFGDYPTTWLYCKEKQMLSWMRDCPNHYVNNNVYIDDIGCEAVIREYGSVVDVVGDFIQNYHYKGKGRFFGTTNLKAEMINDKYGGRVLDRVLEMCVCFRLEGNSKRERIIL